MNLVLMLKLHGQQQLQKVSLPQDGRITIGRGWQNDVIVDDEFVDAMHVQLSLSEQGELCVEDLGSQNGTQIDNRNISGSVVCKSGAAFTVGDTSIVVYDPQTEVAPATKRNSTRLLSNRFNSIGGVVIATLAVVLSLLISIYGMSGVAATGERVVGSFVGTGVYLFLWCLLAALVGKLFRNETNARLHWVFISLVSAVIVVLTFVLDVVKFNLDSDVATLVIDNVFTFAMVAVVAYVTFSFSTRLSRSKKVVVVSLLALAPVVKNLGEPMLVEQHEAWSSWASVNKMSHPPAFLLKKPTTLEAHLTTTEKLFAALDEEVEREAGDHAPGAEPGGSSEVQMSVID